MAAPGVGGIFGGEGLTEEQLHNYEQALKARADRDAAASLTSEGNPYANYGAASMTNTVNNMNYNRQDEYYKALQQREDLAQKWQQVANQRMLTQAQVKQMANEHLRGLTQLGETRANRLQQQYQFGKNYGIQKGQLAETGKSREQQQRQFAAQLGETKKSRQQQQEQFRDQLEESRQGREQRHGEFLDTHELGQAQLGETQEARREHARQYDLRNQIEQAQIEEARLRREQEAAQYRKRHKIEKGQLGETIESRREQARQADLKHRIDVENLGLTERGQDIGREQRNREMSILEAQQRRANAMEERKQKHTELEDERAREVADKAFEYQKKQNEIKNLHANMQHITNAMGVKGQLSTNEFAARSNSNLQHLRLQMDADKLRQYAENPSSMPTDENKLLEELLIPQTSERERRSMASEAAADVAAAGASSAEEERARAAAYRQANERQFEAAQRRQLLLHERLNALSREDRNHVIDNVIHGAHAFIRFGGGGRK